MRANAGSGDEVSRSRKAQTTGEASDALTDENGRNEAGHNGAECNGAERSATAQSTQSAQTVRSSQISQSTQTAQPAQTVQSGETDGAQEEGEEDAGAGESPLADPDDETVVSYGIRRREDGSLFVDYGINPSDGDWTWSTDESVATLFPTFAQALAATPVYHLGSVDKATGVAIVDEGYEIAAVSTQADDILSELESLEERPATVYVLRRDSDGEYAVDWGGVPGAPCDWTDSRDIAVESGSPDREEMMAVCRRFGFADEEGMKEGYRLEGVSWGLPQAEAGKRGR